MSTLKRRFIVFFYSLIQRNSRMKTKIFKRKLFYILIFFLMIMSYVFGVGEYLMTTSFDNFNYPLHVDMHEVIRKVKNNEYLNVKTINSMNFNIILENKAKCQDDLFQSFLKPRILFVVKSAVPNFKLRAMIRKTWGFQNRFSDVLIRTIFVLGVTRNISYSQPSVNRENLKYRDILQGDFIDSYFNNTMKTMLSLMWAEKNCKGAEVFAFIDDDYYISTKNLLKYVENFQSSSNTNPGSNKNFRNEKFFGGYVFPNSAPQRFKFSKWYVTLKEYPFARWPPYITGGAYLLSYPALSDIVITSKYTNKFRFDDIYLGILAKRANLTLTQIDNFYFWEQPYHKFGYKDIIAIHGYKDPHKLAEVWYEQRDSGNA